MRALTGAGELFQQDNWVASVAYALRRWDSDGLTPPAPGAPPIGDATNQVLGIVIVVGGAHALPVGEACRLVLADGRQVRVCLSRLECASVTYGLRLLDACCLF